MISLTDSQLTFLQQITAPLEPPDRSRFLEELATQLQGVAEIGDGSLHRAAMALLRTGQFWRPPAQTADPYPMRKALRTP